MLVTPRAGDGATGEHAGAQGVATRTRMTRGKRVKQLSIVPPLARAGVDRDSVARALPDLFDVLRAEPGTVVLPLHDGKAPVRDGALVLSPLASADPVVRSDSTVLAYLGRTLEPTAPEAPGSAIVLAVLDDAAYGALDSLLAPAVEWADLRDIGGDLSARDAGLLVEALALARWHTNYGFCPRCGQPNVVEQSGWVRRCPDDGFEVYPRIDPAVIVAIRDADDRLLLGGGRGNWYSVLAGFVEAGEPIEAAVVREVHEESGLTVRVDGYLGSQSWPYPLSLMLAFTALVTDADPNAALTPDGEEITHLEWFTRDELRRRRGEIRLPGTSSIARSMIESWLGEPIEPTGGALAEPTEAPNTFIAGTDVP